MATTPSLFAFSAAPHSSSSVCVGARFVVSPSVAERKGDKDKAILVEISVFQAFPESQRVELRSQRESYGPLTPYIIDTAAQRKRG